MVELAEIYTYVDVLLFFDEIVIKLIIQRLLLINTLILLSATWLPQGLLWAIIERAACVLSMFNPKVTMTLVMRLGP